MILSILVCLVLTWALQVLAPAWWWIMVAPLLWCFFKAENGWRGFLVGSLSAALLWLGGSLFYLNTSGVIIAQRVEAAESLSMVISITVLLAALAGGLSGLAGGLLRTAFRPGKN